MREDYGNITLNDNDDGFGDTMGGSSLEMEPELLRDGSVSHHDNFGSLGGSGMDFEPEKRPDISLPGPSGSGNTLDAPINNDGFGGVGVTDFMSGGLFEDGSLFDDPVPGGSASVRAPPSERTGYDGEDDFPSAPSPIHSDGSRPATPMEEDNMSLGGEQPPMLNETPVTEKQAPSNKPTPARLVDTTTLLQNEDESFALAPVEASALKGQRRQRKRKLIVDETKAITGEGMKAQLSDSADIVTTLDIAPPTKRLMHWKETGGVEELFSLPGRKLFARLIVLDYQANLKNNNQSPDELFVTLPSVHEREDDFQLENVGGYQDKEDAEFASPKKRGPKRKAPEEKKENAYQKRQEELAKQQEEFAAQQKRLREEAETANVSLPAGQVPPSPAQPATQEGSFQPWASQSPYPGTPGYDPAQSFGQVAAPFTPAHSAYEGAPSMGYPTPQHEASYA